MMYNKRVLLQGICVKDFKIISKMDMTLWISLRIRSLKELGGERGGGYLHFILIKFLAI